MRDDNLVRKRYGTVRRCQVLRRIKRAQKHILNRMKIVMMLMTRRVSLFRVRREIVSDEKRCLNAARSFQVLLVKLHFHASARELTNCDN